MLFNVYVHVAATKAQTNLHSKGKSSQIRKICFGAVYFASVEIAAPKISHHDCNTSYWSTGDSGIAQPLAVINGMYKRAEPRWVLNCQSSTGFSSAKTISHLRRWPKVLGHRARILFFGEKLI